MLGFALGIKVGALTRASFCQESSPGQLDSHEAKTRFVLLPKDQATAAVLFPLVSWCGCPLLCVFPAAQHLLCLSCHRPVQ